MSTATEQIGATVPSDLAAQVRELAAANERSFSAEVRLALRHWVASTPTVVEREPQTKVPA